MDDPHGIAEGSNKGYRAKYHANVENVTGAFRSYKTGWIGGSEIPDTVLKIWIKEKKQEKR